MEIIEVYGFPNGTSFRGGYDILCSLEITAEAYTVRSERYYSATGALYDFYVALQNAYDKLNGKAIYNVYCAENDLEFEVTFDNGKVKVSGSYQDNPHVKNVLSFEFISDQSYFKEVLNDLKKIVLMFGDKKGMRK
ncbi:MAG: hypothetical protein K2O39_06320 [Clostridiales bacterium]|nr:hypothetical protein [Clostridiales bacterium]